MKFFKKSHDGGKESGVTGYWLIEWKAGFSIVLLRFSPGSREAFHNHAFNALTWWLAGSVREVFLEGGFKDWEPSFIPKWTPRSCFHKILAQDVSWALSIRGPWSKTWQEHKHGKLINLTHGRKVIS